MHGFTGLPAGHHTLTDTTGAVLGQNWNGPWQHPAATEDSGDAWYARSVHDHVDDTFLQDFATQAQAENFLRIRHQVAARHTRDTELLAHPGERTCAEREVMIRLEGSEDQPIPALYTFGDGPRFRPEIAEIVIALLNRGYHADHERPLACRDGDVITVAEPNYYPTFPAYAPTEYRPGDDGRYPLIADWSWYPVNDENEESPPDPR